MIGRTPDTSPGLDWIGANFHFDTNNGSALFNGGNNAMAGFTLDNNYFQNNPGIYELSVDLTLTDDGASTAWMAIGFSETINTLANRGYYQANISNSGNPWLFLRENGEAEVRLNGATSLGISTGNSVTDTKLTIVYDTTQPNWSFTAAVGGVEIDLNGTDPGTAYVFSGNPTSLKSVGIGASNALSANSLDNFSLTQIPEPSPFFLVLLSGLTLTVFLRRRRRD